MNIQEAKDAIRDAVGVYLSKDRAGNYLIPRNRQRPLFILGPPGLGKTAIVSQIAAEMGVGFVSYTITHHTRQSAIGLPRIATREYGGEDCYVSEYTMSEIVASVYDTMDATGVSEGLLFIDEINCVSETLAPAMLDLLQNKKFGPHRIPDGWILVSAGNPREFNSSAREFDVATQDRIRVIEVEPDTNIWLRYAMDNGIHDAVINYLQSKPQNLLRFERTVTGPKFVTPRAWEDLSAVLTQYSEMEFPVDQQMVSQYIRDPEVSSEFVRYLDYYNRSREKYDIMGILDGTMTDLDQFRVFDPAERMAMITMMVSTLNAEAESVLDCEYLAALMEAGGVDRDSMKKRLKQNLTPDERRRVEFVLSESMDETALAELGPKVAGARPLFESHVGHALDFLKSAYGGGRELATLVSGLIGCYSVVVISDVSGALYRYNDIVFGGGAR